MKAYAQKQNPAQQEVSRSDTFAPTRFAHDFSRIPVHSKAPVGLQAKLPVSTPGDTYEQEADRVANQVTNLNQPELRRACACGGGCPTCMDKQAAPEHLQMNSIQSNDIPEIEAPPIVQEVLRSPGQPLDSSTRAFMEPRFGHDFGMVRVHTDARAVESANAMRARAYTVGQQIAFDSDQYRPDTSEGRLLLAHELSHTLQNQDKASGKIQRKIVIDGAPYWPTKEDYEKHDKGLLDKMHNGGNEPDYSFATLEEFQHEVGVRTSAMKTVVDVIDQNNTSVRFGFYNYEEGEFRLPEKYWERTKRKEYHFRQGTIGNKPITPADAVESIFNNGQYQTYLDCNMMLVAIQYKAMLDAYGTELFNKMFPGGQNLIIGQNKKDNPQTPNVNEGYQSTASRLHPLFDQKLYTKIEIAEGEDPLSKLVPGDWLYFKNAGDYVEFVDGYNRAMEESTLDPGRYAEFRHFAEWQGEHAIYLGEEEIQAQPGKNVQKFAGFGLEDVKAYQDMIDMMISACKFEYKSMQLAEKGDFVTSANKIDDIPDSVVKGKPRISQIFRLNTANIETLGK